MLTCRQYRSVRRKQRGCPKNTGANQGKPKRGRVEDDDNDEGRRCRYSAKKVINKKEAGEAGGAGKGTGNRKPEAAVAAVAWSAEVSRGYCFCSLLP